MPSLSLVSTVRLYTTRVTEADDAETVFSIIYKVIEEMEEAMKVMLDPEFEEKVIGEAVIRETLRYLKSELRWIHINGKVTRDSKVRVIRDGRNL